MAASVGLGHTATGASNGMVISPFGRHQASVLAAGSAHSVVAAFDLFGRDQATVEVVMKALTHQAQIAFGSLATRPIDRLGQPSQSSLETLVGGAAVAESSPVFAVGVGASLFDSRFGLGALRPSELVPMPVFPHDQLEPKMGHGDMVVQVSGDTESACIATLRRVAADLQASAELRWSMSGFAGTEARNLMGFSEGQGNPAVAPPDDLNAFPWVDASDQAWAAGGSYLAVRLIKINTTAWDRTPLSGQESVIGRRKISGARFANELSVGSHVGRLQPSDGDGVAMVRRSYNYANGMGDQGLIFMAHQRSFRDGFLRAQERLAGEKLHDYTTTFGGGFFLALPGLASIDDWYGSALLS